jgi:hypothetical protein
MYGYLTNHNGVPSDTTDSSYTIMDSIASNYWYAKGPNYPCSLVTVLYDSVVGGGWSPCDTDTVRANEKFSLTASGKNSSTTYFYRSISTPIGEAASNFVDTTKTFSVTTEASGDIECDSITNIGVNDSTATTISVMGRLECLSDSTWVKFATDTNNVTDSTFISISGSSVGDTIIFTKTGLLPSTQYFFQWRDSTYLSLWRSTYTRDSISDTLYDTIVEPITITVQPLPDTVASGDSAFFSCAFSNADSVVGFVNNVRYVKNDTITWYVHPDSNYNGSTVYFVGYNESGSDTTDTVTLTVYNRPVIHSLIPNQWYGKHAALSGTKSVEVNGSSVTVPSQTDSTFYFNYQPESTKGRFGVKVSQGGINDSSTVDWATSKNKVKIKVK